jgi:4-hydroxy-tetrahydrodipicolinate synthase
LLIFETQKKSIMNTLKGVGVALVTPFNEDLSVDFHSLTKLVNYNIDNGTNFLVVLGTTAEAATLSEVEKKQVIEHIIQTNAGRLPLVLGIGGNNTLEVKNQIENTDLSNFQAILSVSPYYNKPNQEGLYQHYKALAATGKQIIIYNVPSRTGQNVEAATTVRLAKEFPNLFMIKEAAPNILQYFDILRNKPENFHLVSGDDEFTLPVTLAGGSGVISVIAQAYPKEFSTMVQLALDRKVDEAYHIHNKMVEITRLIFAEGNPCGIKTILAEMGIIKNYLRLPLIPASSGLQEKIKKEMTGI